MLALRAYQSVFKEFEVAQRRYGDACASNVLMHVVMVRAHLLNVATYEQAVALFKDFFADRAAGGWLHDAHQSGLLRDLLYALGRFADRDYALRTLRELVFSPEHKLLLRDEEELTAAINHTFIVLVCM